MTEHSRVAHPFGTNDFTIDTTTTDLTDQSLSLCANHCFAGTTSYSTVPFYTAGTPRSLTLVYTEERAHPRPVIDADLIPIAGSAPATQYRLQATLNGTSVTFLTGGTTLSFANPFVDSVHTMRVAGQFDARSYPTGVYTLVVTVTATFRSGLPTSLTHTYTRLLAIDNEAHSPIAHGWTVAGAQRLYVSGTSYLVTDGTGDATIFATLGAQASDYTTLTYNSTTHLYTRTYLDGRTVLFTAAGLDTLDTDRLGNTTSYGYDGTGRLSWVKDPVRTGGFGSPPYLSLSYGTYGLASIAETGGPGTARSTTVTVASDSTLRTLTDPDGVASSLSYDASGRLATVVDRRGDTTTYKYHPRSWKLSEVDLPRVAVDAGSGTTVNVVPKILYGPWQSTAWWLDSAGFTMANILWTADTVTDAIGRKTFLTPDRWGQPLQLVDPAGRVTTITRSGMLPIKVGYPTGGTDTAAYVTGTPLPSYVQTAHDSVVHYAYGAKNQIDSVWGPGVRSEYRFLDATTGRIDSVRYRGSNTLKTRFRYDAHNRLVSVTDPQGHVDSTFYDATFGNPDSVRRPGGLFSATHVDAYGRDSTSHTSGSSLVRQTLYDKLNRVIRTWHTGLPGTYPSDTTFITYDALFPVRLQQGGARVAGGGQVYKFAYNALGWLTQRYDTKDTTHYLSYRYDSVGRQTSVTNRRGQLVTLTYDNLDRMLTRTINGTYADTFSYSTDGLLITALRKNVSRDYIYVDTSGQVDSLYRGIAGLNYVLHYTTTYDSYFTTFGLATTTTSVTTNSGVVFTTATDRFQYIPPMWDSLTLSGGGGGAGKSAFFPNADGLDTLWSFAHLGVPLRTTHTAQHQLDFQDFASYSAPLLRDSLDRVLTYDALGRVSAVHRWGLNGRILGQSVVYDSLGRLQLVRSTVDSACTDPEDTLAFGYQYNCGSHLSSVTQDSATYDGWGNRRFAGATYDTTANRLLTGPSGVSYTYDADGNVVTRTHGGVTDSLFWSALGLLDSVASGGSSGLRHMYEYNAFGQLVRRQTKVGAGSYAVDRYFLWDAQGQLLAELAYPGTALIAQYVYRGTDRPIALVTDSGGTTVLRYMYQDPAGMLTGVIRDSLRLAQYTQYSAWGKQVARSINTLGDTNRLGWKGLMYEGDSTKLYFVRNRWYDPAVGRFISEDPIGIAGGMNLYAFANNDPINGSDPSGTDPCYDADGNEISCDPGQAQPLDPVNITASPGGGDISGGFSIWNGYDPYGWVTSDPWGSLQDGSGGGGSYVVVTSHPPAAQPKPKPEPPPKWLMHDWAVCGKSLATTALSVGLDVATAGEYGEIKAGAKLGEEALDVGLRKLARNGGNWSGHVARAMDRAASSQMQANVSARLLGVQTGFNMQNAVGAASNFIELIPFAGSLYGGIETAEACYNAVVGQ